MGGKRRLEKMEKPAKKPRIEVEHGVGKSLEDLQSLWDFDCGVAVWLHDCREMSNEVVQFLHLTATEFGAISRCFKFGFQKKRIGMTYLLENRDKAIRFSSLMMRMRSPHGDYLFRVEPLGSYLRTVAEIEQQLDEELRSDADVKVIVRNLRPFRTVVKRVLTMCAIFGTVNKYEEFRVVGKNFEFHHIQVSYKYAVQAFGAMIGLDGKWIVEQNHPLTVEILPDQKMKSIAKEMLKRDKLLFHPSK